MALLGHRPRTHHCPQQVELELPVELTVEVIPFELVEILVARKVMAAAPMGAPVELVGAPADVAVVVVPRSR